MKRLITGLACLSVLACSAWSQDPTTDTDNTATSPKIIELEKRVEEREYTYDPYFETYLWSDMEDITLGGIDLTFSRQLGAGRRLLLQGEALRHRRAGSTRYGYYAFGDYAWSTSWSTGLRYGWTEYPQSEGRRRSELLLVLTHKVTESMLCRVEAGRCSSAYPNWGSSESTVGYLQLVWGFGPHSRNEARWRFTSSRQSAMIDVRWAGRLARDCILRGVVAASWVCVSGSGNSGRGWISSSKRSVSPDSGSTGLTESGSIRTIPARLTVSTLTT